MIQKIFLDNFSVVLIYLRQKAAKTMVKLKQLPI